MSIPMSAIKGYYNSKPGIQVGTKMVGKITKNSKGIFEYDMDGIRFMQQIGVEWLMVNDPPANTAKEFIQIREQLEKFGFKIYRLANNRLHNMPEITLNLEGRDRILDEYLQFTQNLGEAGIYYSTYAHMANGIWRNETNRKVRGGADAGGLDLNAPNKGYWQGAEYEWPLSHGRYFSEDELWENYTYFIKKVVPVAESAGVHIGIHPDDPPAYEMAGIPRKMFGTFEGYKRAMEIADSANIGVCFCAGCWLQAGDKTGCTSEEFIRYFAQRGKLFKAHLRNVTGIISQPGGFNETYPDAGYYNLSNIIEVLAEVGFDGAVINDHLVDMVGGHYAGEAYFTAYLKGAVGAIQRRLPHA